MKTNAKIRVEEAHVLKDQELVGERVSIGAPGDYKPCVACLPDGTLLLVAFTPFQLEEKKA